MKVCPVCNETFADEMKFCDLDGTRLARQAEATGGPAHHRTWSLLGIGLLVGALVLSAVSVFLIPRSRALPSATNTPVSATPSNTKPADANNSSSANENAAAGEQPEIVIAETPPDPNAKKKDKAKTTAENEATPALNPKAAAQTNEDNPAPAPPAVEPPPAPKKIEPAPAPKPVSETHEPEAAPKPAASTEPKHDPKHQNAARDDKKKSDDKDKKKGGGFFKVFKKIFGKD